LRHDSWPQAPLGAEIGLEAPAYPIAPVQPSQQTTSLEKLDGHSRAAV